LVVEGLSSDIHHARKNRLVNGIQVGGDVSLTHMLFIVDIFLFGLGLEREI